MEVRDALRTQAEAAHTAIAQGDVEHLLEKIEFNLEVLGSVGNGRCGQSPRGDVQGYMPTVIQPRGQAQANLPHDLRPQVQSIARVPPCGVVEAGPGRT